MAEPPDRGFAHANPATAIAAAEIHPWPEAVSTRMNAPLPTLSVPELTSRVAALTSFLCGRGPVVVLTGAGCSTESGIPAYRDAEGNWRGRTPVQGQEFASDAAARRRYWSRSILGWPHFSVAAPNAAHHALAALEAQGVVASLITQNVDGLHQRAGSRAVTELHGSLRTVRCLHCDKRVSRDEVQKRLEAENPAYATAASTPAPDGDASPVEHVPEDFHVPHCESCGGVLKPDVVFFGDSVERSVVQHCMQAVGSAGALLCVGTSLTVYSGFRFCRHAEACGVPIVALGIGRTRADDMLALKVEAPCGPALHLLAAELGAGAAIQA